MFDVGVEPPLYGEDPCRFEQTTEASEWAHRDSGRSTHARARTKHGRPARVRARWCARNGSFRGRLVQESEETIVVTKPGNAGGAKGLWFGVRSNEAEGGGLA